MRVYTIIMYRVLVAPEGVCSSRCDSERVEVAVNSAARKSRNAHGLALKKRWYRVYTNIYIYIGSNLPGGGLQMGGNDGCMTGDVERKARVCVGGDGSEVGGHAQEGRIVCKTVAVATAL